MSTGRRRSDSERPARYRELLRVLDSSPELRQSYETLLSSLRLRNGAKPLRTLLLTSAQPREGKTTLSVCFGLALARAGQRTLIVDADLRRPRIHHIFELDNDKGLAPMVFGQMPGKDAVHTIQVPAVAGGKGCTVSVMTSGRSSTGAFDAIQSPSLADAIGDLARSYDRVIIDSPPVLSVSDPLLLAPLVDGVVLIVATGTVTGADAKRAKDQLEQAGGRILGVVMNRFDENLHGAGFHPYHGYYDPPEPRS
jgi:capsular exopolysaccharide synthesis family protein